MSSIRCPACKAENTRGTENVNCRRCKTDLSLLFALEDQRDHTLSQVADCLRAGQVREAVHLANHVDWMRHDERSRRMLAVLALLTRDFERAWQEQQAMASENGEPGA